MKTCAAALALIGLALPVQAQKGISIMDITRKADLKITEGPADFCTGRVVLTQASADRAPQ